jgi:dipeptidyl aminopeptidase/acylaminoacyl peptidase
MIRLFLLPFRRCSIESAMALRPTNVSRATAGLLLALAWLAGAPLAALAQKRPITHQDVWMMKRMGEPVVSPDGRWIVFSLTEPDYDPAKQTSDLWVLRSDGTEPPRRLTYTKEPENGVAWSPDGTRMAFSTKREGDQTPQIYILPMSGGEARRVTNVPGGATGPQWRPDGKAILFQSQVDPIAEQRKDRKWNARIYDAMPIRFWNAWLDERRPHVFVQELSDSAQPLDLVKGSRLAESAGFNGVFNETGGQDLQAVWAPDGKSIVFVAYANRDRMMGEEVESKLFVVAAAGGEPAAITERGASYEHPHFSPTGNYLYAQTERSPDPAGRLYSLTRLAQFGWPDTGKVKILTKGWDRSIGSLSISHDGRNVYLAAEDDGFDQLFELTVSSEKLERIMQVTEGGYTSVQPVEGGMVAEFQTSLRPPEIVRLDPAKGSHTMLTNFNAAAVADIDAPASIHFWFVAKNGKRIHSIMTLPPRFDPAKKYPLVVSPHGGPNSMSKDNFTTRWNSYLLTSPGYVLLRTDYTGSTGFGEEFADDIEHDVLRGPAQEILEAIDEAAKRYPYIDTSRQAAIGASYGGYLMNWFNGHTKQFKCLVIHAGAINNESQYGSNDGGIDRELRMGGPIWEKGGQWNDESPLRYANEFSTPALITDGEQDFRVPLTESITTFKILQRRGIPARLIVFPDEGHWILKGENNRLHMEEVLAWLKRYL